MGVRRFIQHTDKYGRVHRFEIDQDGYGGSATSMKGENDFKNVFDFSHDKFTSEGEILKFYENVIQQGTLDLFPMIEDDTDFQLLQDIFNADEKEFQAIYKIDGSEFWRGDILPDLLEYPESSYPFAGTITAKDFTSLKGKDYSLRDTRETWISIISGLLSNTGYGLDIETATTWTEEHLDNSITGDYDYLNHIRAETKAFREFARDENETDQPKTQWEVLERALRNNCLLLRQSEGRFKLHQISAWEDPTNVPIAVYDSTGTQTQSVTFEDRSLAYNRDLIRIKKGSPTKTYPGLWRIKNKFAHRTKVSRLDTFTHALDTTNSSDSDSELIISDGGQRLEYFIFATAEDANNDATMTARYVIKAGSYYWDQENYEWTENGGSELVNTLELTQTTGKPGLYLWQGEISQTTTLLPSDADGAIVYKSLNANVADESNYVWNVNIQNQLAKENSKFINYRLTQSNNFSEDFTLQETWFGDGPLAYSPSALRYGTGDGDVTTDSWQRRGSTSYRSYHENVLKESLDVQRSNITRHKAKTYGVIDVEKALSYRSKNIIYGGGSIDGTGDWDLQYLEVNVQTSGTDTFEDIPKFEDEDSSGSGSSSAGGGSTSSAAWNSITGKPSTSGEWRNETGFDSVYAYGDLSNVDPATGRTALDVFSTTEADNRFLNEANQLSEISTIAGAKTFDSPVTLQDTLNFSNSSVLQDAGTNFLELDGTGKPLFPNDVTVGTSSVQADLHIYGDIFQHGTTYETEVEQLKTKKDFIIQREGAVGGLAAGDISGSKILKADGTNNVVFGTDNSAIARVGWEGGTLQALLTREDSPVTNGLHYWDSGNSRSTTSSDLTFDGSTFATLAGSFSDTLTVNGTKIFTKGEEQPVGTGDDVEFAGVTSNTDGTGGHFTLIGDVGGAQQADWRLGLLNAGGDPDFAIYDYSDTQRWPLRIERLSPSDSLFIRTSGDVHFGSQIQTSVGHLTDIYQMDQDVRTTDDVEHLGLSLNTPNLEGYTLNVNGIAQIKDAADFRDDVQIDGALTVDLDANFKDQVGSPDFVSQTTDWQITKAGAADFRSVYADEIRTQAFIAEINEALVGAETIGKSRAKLSRNFTIPANTNTATLYVEDLEGFEGSQVFSENDWVLLQYMDKSGGGLTVAEVWGKVTNYTDLAGGEQSWTFTTQDDGGVPGNVVYAGSISIDYGQSGDGVIRSTVLDQQGAPYTQVETWTTDPSVPSNFTARTRVGILDGITNASGAGLYGENTFLTGSLVVGDLTKTANYFEYQGSSLIVNTDDAYLDLGNNMEIDSGIGIDVGMDFWHNDGTGSLGNGILSWTSSSITGAGWDWTSGAFQKGTDIALDAANKKIYLNDGTFGNTGIQLDYNAGTPRIFAGVNGGNFVRHDGSDFEFQATNTSLLNGTFTATDAILTGKLTAGNVEVGQDITNVFDSGNPTADGFYANDYNYWYGDGKKRFGGASKYVRWDGSNINIEANNASIGDSSGWFGASDILSYSNNSVGIASFTADSDKLTDGTVYVGTLANLAESNWDFRVMLGRSMPWNTDLDGFAATSGQSASTDDYIGIFRDSGGSAKYFEYQDDGSGLNITIGDMWGSQGIGANTGFQLSENGVVHFEFSNGLKEIAGINFDESKLHTGDSTNGYVGMGKTAAASDPAFWAGADNNDGSGGPSANNFLVTQDGRLYYDALGGPIYAYSEEAGTGDGDSASNINSDKYVQSINTSAVPNNAEERKLVTEHPKRFGINTLKVLCHAELSVLSGAGATTVTATVTDSVGGSTIDSDSFTINSPGTQTSTLTLDVSGISNGDPMIVEVHLDVSASENSSVTARLQKRISITEKT